MDSTEHGELLLAAHAGGHGGGRVGAQHPTLWGTGYLGFEQPVLLNGATRQTFAAGDAHWLTVKAFL
ncbi:hypothetical protein D3C76_1763340 [compost metagenome]